VVRLGTLLPGGEDRWWEIGDPETEPVIAREVVSAIRDLGLPWLRSRIDQVHRTSPGRGT
jgi:hypothetical protein